MGREPWSTTRRSSGVELLVHASAACAGGVSQTFACETSYLSSPSASQQTRRYNVLGAARSPRGEPMPLCWRVYPLTVSLRTL